MAFRVFLFFIFLVGFCFETVDGQVKKPEQTDEESIFLPAPRELTRALSRAKKDVEEERYADAVSALGAILASEFEDDFFVRNKNNSTTYNSITSAVIDVIGSMPKRGREVYELKFGILAQKQLEKAIADRNVEAIRLVSTRFFHTKAGYAATMILGRYYLDLGEPLSAVFTFERLMRSPEARDRFEPQLSVLLATAWHFAGKSKNSASTLESLSREYPKRKMEVGGEVVELFSDSAKADEWLQKVFGKRLSSISNLEIQWVMHRGNIQRNGQSNASEPLIQPFWRAKLHFESDRLREVERASLEYEKQGIAATPSTHALAVGNFIITRTTDRVIGIDFETGKRRWLYPWDDLDDIGAIDPQDNEIRKRALNKNQIQSRVWQDHVYGQMSSDGKRVYFVDGLDFPDATSSSFAFGNNRGTGFSNRLVALQVQTETGESIDGKLRWSVGDKDGSDEPKLANAFFLGPPMPLQDELYVIVEIAQEIRLVVLDAETGRLKWGQQLASVELVGSLSRNRQRRLSGATPSYSNGVLVCPTAAGALVSIDVSTRSLLWGYRYPNVNVKRLNNYSRITLARPGEKWADGSVMIAEGKVIATPIESDKIHCIDLLNGKGVWSTARGDLLYVAGVSDGKVIAVGPKEIRAFDLDKGSEVYKVDLSKQGRVTGTGYMNENMLFLPTSESKIVKFSLKDQKFIAIPTDQVLGNLISYKNKIISNGAEYISAYYDEQETRLLVNKALDSGGELTDVGQLKFLGQLLLNDGKYNKSLEALTKAFEKQNTRATRHLLSRAMLLAIKNDFAGSLASLEKVESLGAERGVTFISEPDEIAEYMSARVQGMVSLGRPLEATDALIELVNIQRDLDFHSPQDGEVDVRWDRWVKATVQDLMDKQDNEKRNVLEKKIEKRMEEVLAKNSTKDLQKFMDFFGEVPAKFINKGKLALARNYFVDGNFLSAEFLFNRLSANDEKSIRATAQAGLAGISEATGNAEIALKRYEAVAAEFGDVACWDGATGEELLRSAKENLMPNEKAKHSWPYGEVVVGTAKSVARRVTSTRPVPLNKLGAVGDFSDQYAFWSENAQKISVRDRNHKKVREFSLTDPKDPRARRFSMQSYAPRYMINGQLLIVAVSEMITGVDLYKLINEPESDPVIWRERFKSINDRSQQITGSYRTDIWGLMKVTMKQNNRACGGMGWVSHNGFCFIRDNDLVCIDPATGQRLWKRQAEDPTGEILSNEESVFLIANNNCWEYSLFNGKEIRKFELPKISHRIIDLQTKFLSWTTKGSEHELFLYDLVTGKKVWTHNLPNGSKASLIGSTKIAFVSPKGNLKVIDLESGKIEIDSDQKLGFSPKSLEVRTQEDRYMFFVGSNSPTTNLVEGDTYISVSGFQGRILRGKIFAISKKNSQPIWQTPATIDPYGLLAGVNDYVPAIVLVRRVHKRNGGRLTTDLLIIDSRDGKRLYSQKVNSYFRGLNILLSPEENKMTLSGVATQPIELEFTDRPLPPVIPIQMGKASSNTAHAKSVSLRRIVSGAFVAVAKPHLPTIKIPSGSYEKFSMTWNEIKEKLIRAQLKPAPEK